MDNFLKMIAAVDALCVTFHSHPAAAKLLVALSALGVTWYALYVVAQCLRS
ncbi:hypothetical protein [Burkholderia pseudomallei]|uniref:hypothetical protein n=1 Tax=Burkholderia pseudomallei TaxID=28450 RepID=UPI0012B9EE46|nr:hypothetical protein [Burkholderia pseudomallei]MBM5620345.1 hypothetical protein [Burkholderia pseudomallei]MBM5634741.1 hypothetical protein [Burkholderia pseudomallei]MBM5663137.1 hypothetical protein [Burkholderia pseudomallei]